MIYWQAGEYMIRIVKKSLVVSGMAAVILGVLLFITGLWNEEETYEEVQVCFEKTEQKEDMGIYEPVENV